MSNAQTMAEAFAPIQARDRENVMQATWGHLAPIKNTTYRGRILFCKSEYNSGTITLIATEFEGLDDSPWFYDAIHEFLYEFPNLEYGVVYTMQTTLRNYRWWGKPVKVLSLT